MQREKRRRNTMLPQSSHMFDPEQVLQQVWRGDYPPTWQVFFGPVGSAIGCLLTTFAVIIGLIAFLFLLTGGAEVIGSITAGATSDAIGSAIAVAVVMLISIGLIILLVRGIRAARKRASRKPGPTMVVMPEGVVAYQRKQTRSFAFAHIAQMQLRVRARTNTVTTYSTTIGANGMTTMIPLTTSVPAAPSIWLDLVFHDGQRGVWHINFAPQDTIAQSIIEAYTRYRAQH